jgi:hypothetical protein
MGLTLRVHQEEGGQEVAYHPGQGSQQEAQIEPGVLYQPLPEAGSEGEAKVRGLVELCRRADDRGEKTSEPCARYASLWGEITKAWHWVKHHVHKLVATAIAGVSTLVIGATGALATSLCGLAAGEDPLVAFDCGKIGSMTLAAFGGGVAATVDAWEKTKN